MKKSRFTESQIVAILKEAEAGVTVAEIARKLRPETDGLVQSFPANSLQTTPVVHLESVSARKRVPWHSLSREAR